MDLTLFKLINRLAGHSKVADLLMIFISNRIRYAYILITLLFLLKKHFKKRIAIETGGSVLLSFLLHMLIKLFYYKPRPFKKRRVGILIPSKIDSTFPSKHTILAFAASVSVLLFNRTLGAFMLGLSALTGFSRVWVGHHYPSDIIGSAFLGALSSIVMRAISFSKFKYEN
jgi:undecaprenyl-diphosphatase